MVGVTYSIGDIADRIGARVEGDPDARVTGLGTLERAQPGELSHLSSRAYRRYLPGTRATAVILRAEDVADCPAHSLIVDNPYLAFARASALFVDANPGPAGIHGSASVANDVIVGVDVRIGPNAVIDAGTVIGDGASIGPNCVVGSNCRIGAGSRIDANVSVYSRVRMGARCRIHSGSVLGAEGFGYVPDERGQLVEIGQIGGVVLGDDVRIGAASTIDRGAIGDTRIGDGVKIDNQVQIGHNCVIGEHTVICGCVGIVGSTTIGRHCVLAGGVGIGGAAPIVIADRVVVSGMTHVSASIDRPGVYSGGVLHGPTRLWKRNALRFGELDRLARRVAALERKSSGK